MLQIDNRFALSTWLAKRLKKVLNFRTPFLIVEQVLQLAKLYKNQVSLKGLILIGHGRFGGTDIASKIYVKWGLIQP